MVSKLGRLERLESLRSGREIQLSQRIRGGGRSKAE